jgi:dolichyl-diphosphooligosaccharide--protein glycosyltransferase
VNLRSKDRGARAASLLGLGLFASAFLVRITNFGFVFVAGRVRFPSGRDELYHVRKIVYQAARFPALLDFDPYLSFPFGARPVWPPFLDWLLAGLARLFVPGGDAAAVEQWIVWIPPLLGAATVLAAFEIGRRYYSLLAGCVAGLLLASMPAHHVHSQLGQVDHQVVVGLVATLLLASAMALLSAGDPARQRRLAVLAGAIGAVCLLITPGALPQILPVQGVVVAWARAAADRSAAQGRMHACAILHASAALVVLPACLDNGEYAGMSEYSPLVLSNFQPLWFVAGALGSLVLAELWKRSRVFASRRARIVSVLTLGLVLAAVALALIPELRQTLLQAGGWFTRDEAFLTTVTEVRPLLFPGDRFDASAALASLTLAFVAFPLAWLWLAWRTGFGPERRAASALLLVWAATFFVLTLAQERFANAFAPALALTVAAAVEEARAEARRRLGQRTQWAFCAWVAALVLATLAPPARSFHALFTHSRFAQRQAQGWVPPDSRPKVVVESAARWLREASPPTRGFLDASLRPEYGVLTSWDDGHLVRYRAERPTVQDNFGSFSDRRAYELAPAYFDVEDEELAYRTAQALGARYTIATAQGSGQALPPSPRSVGQRLWRGLGNAGGGAPALARHRLIWAGDLSGAPRAVGAPALDRVAIFEIVPGAWIEGEAAPGARVDFELTLLCGGGRVRYRSSATASGEGRYGIRLPYPTDAPVSTEVRARGPYRVRAGARSAELPLREAEVSTGATVPGPSLR